MSGRLEKALIIPCLGGAEYRVKKPKTLLVLATISLADHAVHMDRAGVSRSQANKGHIGHLTGGRVPAMFHQQSVAEMDHRTASDRTCKRNLTPIREYWDLHGLILATMILGALIALTVATSQSSQFLKRHAKRSKR